MKDVNMPPIKNIKGEKFGMLTVISMGEKIKNSVHWNCLCDCGEKVLVNGAKLRNGHTKSCGCYKIKRTKESNSREHEYIDNGEYYEVINNGDILFIVDKDKKSIVDKLRWKKTKRGYVIHSNRNGKNILMHRLITNAKEFEVVDHINGNKLDNRVNNLRVTSQQVNSCNRKAKSQSKTGILGINVTSSGKFSACIMTHGKATHIGSFKSIEEAITARKQVELEQRGELSYFWDSEEFKINLMKFKGE
jgi:hypothetical protein